MRVHALDFVLDNPPSMPRVNFYAPENLTMTVPSDKSSKWYFADKRKTTPLPPVLDIRPRESITECFPMLIDFLGEANVHPCNRPSFFTDLGYYDPSSRRGAKLLERSRFSTLGWVVSPGGELNPVDCSLTDGIFHRGATA